MIRKALLLAAALTVAPLCTTAEAQVRLPTQPPIRQLTGPSRSSEDSQPIPPAYRPPPGMCRIWLDAVPPAQQPASTDCVTAVRNRPSNGRVIFGDDFVERRNRSKGKRPDDRVDAGTVRFAEPMDALAAPVGGVAYALAPRPHGPQADDAEALSLDARPVDRSGVIVFDQPPARPRASTPPARPRARQADPDDDDDDDPRAVRDSARDGQRRWSEGDTRRRATDSTLSERRRALRDRRDADDRDGYARDGHARDGYARDGYARDGSARDGYGYGRPYYPPPGRANGVCLDRDGDGWCDDYRAGGGYCVDRDGDGRCDDYPELASAPYASSLPPMSAAVDVQHGYGSPIALRWLGTAEVIVRTTQLKRTGSPYRVMWLDANTNRLLQVWTDRDGDGIADRVEIYRNGRVAKIIGR